MRQHKTLICVVAIFKIGHLFYIIKIHGVEIKIFFCPIICGYFQWAPVKKPFGISLQFAPDTRVALTPHMRYVDVNKSMTI